MEHRLQPPALTPNKTEIELAKANYVTNYELIDIITPLINYFKMKEAGHYDSATIAVADNAVETWDFFDRQWNRSTALWNTFMSDENFQYIIDGLSEEHVGQCTKAPVNCNRCYSEKIFNLPSSVSWQSPEEGAALHAEFLELKRAEIRENMK